MSKFMVLLYENGTPKEMHIVETPGMTERGFYQQTVSLDAFRSREAKKLHQHHIKGVPDVEGKRCWVRWYDEFVKDTEITEKCFRQIGQTFEHQFSGKPEFYHTSVWDFYTAIGYDYKNKRYLKTE